MKTFITNVTCACACRWLKYITDAAEVYKDCNPLKTPPRIPRSNRHPKPVMAMTDVPEACEVYALAVIVFCWDNL